MSIQVPESGVLRISASAGSGKTYNLTRVFIRRMLRDRHAYRGMLAITFTNKAANELRERILKRLRSLADVAQDCDELDLFGFSSRDLLASRAAEVLESVLHQPDFLQVGTIDSFFQQVFSSLAIETGLPGGLRPELDLNLVKNEVLEIALSNPDPAAVSILVENLSSQLMESGKDWRTIPYLRKKVLDVVFEDPVVNLFLQNRRDEISEERLQVVQLKLKKFLADLEEKVSAAAYAVIQCLSSMGISPENFDPVAEKNFLGEYARFQKAAQNNEMPDKIMKSYPEKGSLNYAPKSRPLSAEEKQMLQPLLIRYAECSGGRTLPNYRLATNLLNQMASVRLLVFFREILQNLNRDQHRYLLQEVKFLLAGVLDTSEIPYLFEKTGSRLHTLLIDEFQDTDHTQWQVLKALALVIAENDGLFSVVGDVKQSIYGWRGADSSLFNGGLDQDLKPYPVQEASLRNNFRSGPNIVAFNNWLFANLANQFAANLADAGHLLGEAPWAEMLRLNYRDVEQTAALAGAKQDNGFAEVRIRPKTRDSSSDEESADEENESYMSWLPAEIMRLQDAGFRSSDIAILVRKNADAAEAVRVLDQAQRKNLPYDFSFTTAANSKAGSQALFVFLILTIKKGMGIPLNEFEMEQMRCLTVEMKLHSLTEKPDWQEKWLNHPFQQLEADAIFLEQVDYFGLNKVEHLQSMLLHFQEMLGKYLREDSIQYPDFFVWWEKKASELQVPIGTGTGGITIMTIHRSKGLDFGVVIFPWNSSAQGDSKGLHDASFWAYSESEPWNSHPLLRGKAGKGILETDLGEKYEGDVFRRAVEALNTFYVACTRPRYGLILDITTDKKLDKPETGSYRLPVQIALNLKNSEKSLPFPQNSWQMQTDTQELSVYFRLGEIASPETKHKEEDEKSISATSLKLKPENFIPKKVKESSNSSAQTGMLVHRILENTRIVADWQKELQRENKSGFWDKSAIEEAANILNGFFRSAEVQDWFSGEWSAFPEPEMLDEKGNLFRADRILVKGNQVLLIDFKTGLPSEEHRNQILSYRKTLHDASGLTAQCKLVYTATGLITDVQEKC